VSGVTGTCEADKLALEGWGDPDVEPCNEPATLFMADRRLCAGCFDALNRLRGSSDVWRRAKDQEDGKA
jgi:hypothetical protein